MLRFHAKFTTAIHAECRYVQMRGIAAAERARELSEQTLGDDALPSGLKPGTLSTYSAEW